MSDVLPLGYFGQPLYVHREIDRRDFRRVHLSIIVAIRQLENLTPAREARKRNAFFCDPWRTSPRPSCIHLFMHPVSSDFIVQRDRKRHEHWTLQSRGRPVSGGHSEMLDLFSLAQRDALKPTRMNFTMFRFRLPVRDLVSQRDMPRQCFRISNPSPVRCVSVFAV